MVKLKDYEGVVEKFDNCRACLARVLKFFGEEPTNCPDEGTWHDWLIKKVDNHIQK